MFGEGLVQGRENPGLSHNNNVWEPVLDNEHVLSTSSVRRSSLRFFGWQEETAPAADCPFQTLTGQRCSDKDRAPQDWSPVELMYPACHKHLKWTFMYVFMNSMHLLMTQNIAKRTSEIQLEDLMQLVERSYWLISLTICIATFHFTYAINEMQKCWKKKHFLVCCLL